MPGLRQRCRNGTSILTEWISEDNMSTKKNAIEFVLALFAKKVVEKVKAKKTRKRKPRAK